VNHLDPSAVHAILITHTFGRELVYLPCTGSTNDAAKELAAQGAPEGTVVVADEQTAGRGRMGRQWTAPPATCILCSILFRPRLLPTQTQRLTMVCGLAAADAVEETAGLRTWLKWPNDLIVKSRIPNDAKSQGWRKLAGVLTEAAFKGDQVAFAIVGIGINVNVEVATLPELDPNATSILAETGQPTDRAALLAALLAGVERRYEALKAGESPQEEWAARLATLGRKVQAVASGEMLVGVAESVDEDGALLLRAADGVLHCLLVGDVTLSQP
jgi:BirA family biotin operon repressor/biotin-[acetyl-CoA-carboxylase] ligase